MKKTLCFVLAAALCALTVFAASAAPVEYVPDRGSIQPDGDGEYIISHSCKSGSFDCKGSSTLTIAKDTVITCDGMFSVAEDATLIILGTLDLSEAYFSENFGTVRVACCGTLIMGGDVTGGHDSWDTAPIYEGHDLVNGVCRVCGYSASGTTLSAGSVAVLVGVVCLAAGFVVGLLIFKNKKVRSQE